MDCIRTVLAHYTYSAAQQMTSFESQDWKPKYCPGVARENSDSSTPEKPKTTWKSIRDSQPTSEESWISLPLSTGSHPDTSMFIHLHPCSSCFVVSRPLVFCPFWPHASLSAPINHYFQSINLFQSLSQISPLWKLSEHQLVGSVPQLRWASLSTAHAGSAAVRDRYVLRVRLRYSITPLRAGAQAVPAPLESWTALKFSLGIFLDVSWTELTGETCTPLTKIGTHC